MGLIYFMAKKTKELIESGIILLSAENKLDELLLQAKDIVITPETLHVNYQFLLKLKAVYDALIKKMTGEITPHKDEIKLIEGVYKPHLNSIAEILNRHDPVIAQLNSNIKEAEFDVIDAISEENKRIADFNIFVNKTAKAIVSSTDEDELTYIQKLIGLEKTRGKHYGQKLFEKVVEAADELLSLVQAQKVCIREIEKLTKQQAKAVVDSDISLAISLKEQIELKTRVIAENAITIGEKAYKYIESVQQQNDDLVSGAISPRSRRWSYRVYDMELLKKKMPELVMTVENKKEIGKLMKEKADANEIPEQGELQINGIAFFRKLFYIAVKSKEAKDAE